MLTQVGTGFAASTLGDPGARRGDDGASLPLAAATRGEDGDARGEPAPPLGELMRGEPMRCCLGELRAGTADRRSRIPGPTGDAPTCGGCQEHILSQASKSHYTELTDVR